MKHVRYFLDINLYKHRLSIQIMSDTIDGIKG